jgi:hypothetical protein
MMESTLAPHVGQQQKPMTEEPAQVQAIHKNWHTQ